uniref:Alpha-amylase inhibitor n=1 Tax=Streptomyces avermitilis TaxID=33903 RepID=M4GGT3_STRAX|nr:alpha-amylase inhibitor [Streptomyces avermitilis]
MRRYIRSTITGLTAGLLAVSSGVAAQAASREAEEGWDSPPACVHINSDWRYTFVTNDCSSAYDVTVVYRDGANVPCRVASPGDIISFPGYGTQGNTVLGVALCAVAGRKDGRLEATPRL